MPLMFADLFLRTLRELDADTALCERLWTDIATHYSANDRHYHNLIHLDALADELSLVEEQLHDPVAIVLATAYHDIVYNTLRQDNEERSAAYADEALCGLLNPDRLSWVHELILATKTHKHSADEDLNYFTDADLSILGAAPVRYELYAEQIRKEYHHYPDLLYKPGRKRVLAHFLAMPRIYKTEAFFERYENQARRNLSKELQDLR